MSNQEFNFDNFDRVFIIAEMSANHNGSLENAKEIIKAAKRAGADAIKLQTYTADTITLNVDNEDFKVKGGTIWDGETFYDLYKRAYTPWEWHAELFELAKKEGLICFSSPFDFTAVDLLEKLNCPVYKIASLEITDIPLIKYVASKGKPIIFSTGVADHDDIKLAIDTCHKEGNDNIALLKCTAEYPANISDANLIMIKDMAHRYGVVTGLSDHTLGNEIPMLSVMMGAKIIEKHFIVDKNIGGPDASFSLDESEFYSMVQSVKLAETALGTINYSLSEKQKITRQFSRSLYVCEDIEEGGVLTIDNIRSVRPGYGLHPKYFEGLLGKFTRSYLKNGTPLSFDALEDN
jgi:pseudaminic acid synthase